MEIEAGMLLHCPPYSEHEVSNPYDEPLVFLIVYTPAKFKKMEFINHDNRKGLSIKEIDQNLLIDIVNNISKYIKTRIAVLDEDHKEIVSNGFQNQLYEFIKNHQIHDCFDNVMEITVPVQGCGQIYGYIQCGYIIFDRNEYYHEQIYELSEIYGFEPEEMIACYEAIPLLPKSRQYAIKELFQRISNFILEILSKEKIEQELLGKTRELLEKSHALSEVEASLKQANRELIRAKYTSFFNDFSKSYERYYEDLEYPILLEQKMINDICSMQPNKMEETFSKIIEYVKDRNYSYYDVQCLIDEWIGCVVRGVVDRTLQANDLLIYRRQYKEILMKSTTIEDLFDNIIVFFKDLIYYKKDIYFKTGNTLDDSVIQYIQDHYKDDLTLNNVAEKFYVSPNYLSSLINQHSQKSFREHINECRISEAKRLLIESKMKVNTIGKVVGFNRSSYFGYVFKRETGLSPLEYRMQYRCEK